MKTLIAIALSMLAAQAYAHGIEADLDGNASALQASEPRPAARQSAKAQPGKAQPQAEAQRQRIASR